MRLSYFAACPAELRGAILFFFSQRRRDLPAVGRRKEIVVHLSALSSCLPVCLPEAFAALRLCAPYSSFFFLLAKPTVFGMDSTS
jgi:hypothetical protein